MNGEKISLLEKYVSKHLHLLKNTAYEREHEIEDFSFLPGHATMLLALPDLVEEYDRANKPCTANVNSLIDSLPLSFLMKEMIRTATNNSAKDPKHRQFSKIIQNFATYLYMICGKTAYEILSQNLPIPVANTICEFYKFFL